MTNSFKRILAILFESLIETPPWESFLKLMEDYLDCQRCALLLRTPTQTDPGLIISEILGPSAIRPTEVFGAFKDSPFLNIPDEDIYVLSQMMSAKEFKEKHKRHYDYNRRVGTKDLLAINFTDPNTNTSFRFRFVRSGRSRQFGEKEISAMKVLVPYLKTAASIYARMIEQQKQLFIADQTSTKVGVGMILLKSNGELLTMNACADLIFRMKKDFFISQGSVHCVNNKSERTLQRQLRLLTDDGAERSEYSFQVPCSDGGDANWLMMMLRNEVPPEFSDESGDTISLVIFDSRHRTTLSVEQLGQLFGLTPAEAQLTERLVQGDSITEAAEILGRSRSTARVQLSSVFTKTGVHKQHQLISHIMKTVTQQWL